MKTFIALLAFIAVAAAVPGTGTGGFPGTDGTVFNSGADTGAAAGENPIGAGTGGWGAGDAMGAGTSGSVDAMGGADGMGGMGGSSVQGSDTGADTSDTGSDDDSGSDDDGSSDDSAEDHSNGSNNNQASNLGAMSVQQKSGMAFGIIFAVGAVVAAAGVGYFVYRKRQNGAQMLSNA